MWVGYNLLKYWTYDAQPSLAWTRWKQNECVTYPNAMPPKWLSWPNPSSHPWLIAAALKAAIPKTPTPWGMLPGSMRSPMPEWGNIQALVATKPNIAPEAPTDLPCGFIYTWAKPPSTADPTYMIRKVGIDVFAITDGPNDQRHIIFIPKCMRLPCASVCVRRV